MDAPCRMLLGCSSESLCEVHQTEHPGITWCSSIYRIEPYGNEAARPCPVKCRPLAEAFAQFHWCCRRCRTCCAKSWRGFARRASRPTPRTATRTWSRSTESSSSMSSTRRQSPSPAPSASCPVSWPRHVLKLAVALTPFPFLYSCARRCPSHDAEARLKTGDYSCGQFWRRMCSCTHRSSAEAAPNL